MTAEDVRNAAEIREEVADLMAYLDGLPAGVRRTGAFLAYEQRVAELSRELVLTELGQALKIRDSLLTLAEGIPYERIYEALGTLTQHHEQSAERSRKVSRAFRWVLGGAAVAVPLAGFWSSFAPILSGYPVLLILHLLLSERAAKQERIAARLSALRDEISRSFGPSGELLSPAEYYPASARRIESLLGEVAAATTGSARPARTPGSKSAP